MVTKNISKILSDNELTEDVIVLYVGYVYVPGNLVTQTVCVGTSKEWVEKEVESWIKKYSTKRCILLGKINSVLNVNIEK